MHLMSLNCIFSVMKISMTCEQSRKNVIKMPSEVRECHLNGVEMSLKCILRVIELMAML
jgi:hypothetical protein